MPKPLKVDVTPSFYRVRFRDPRCPLGYSARREAPRVVSSVVQGAKTTQCRRGSKWKTQSVLIPRAIKSAYAKIER